MTATKKMTGIVLTLLFSIAATVTLADSSSDTATGPEILSFLSAPAAFTLWLEHHDAATRPDALARTIKAVEQSQLNDAAKMQIVSVSVARLIRTCGSSAQEVLVIVSKQVEGRWLPVMVAAATLVRGPDGLAAQQALIASCTGKDGLETKARAAANAPGQLLGTAIAIRTARPADFARSMPMPLPPCCTTRLVAPTVIAAIQSNKKL